LADVARSRVVCAEHRHNAVRVAIRAGNVGTGTRTGLEWEGLGRPICTHPVARIQWMFNPIPPAVLLIILQRIINTLDTTYKEATR
jgi:hypothetical protein